MAMALVLVLAGAAVAAPPGPPPRVTDGTPWLGHWAENDLVELIGRGLLPAGTVQVSPEAAVTVSEAADFLLRMSGAPPATERPLDAATAKGLIKAGDFSAGRIDAAATVTRELFALWTVRAMGLQSAAAIWPQRPSSFDDVEAVSAKYWSAVSVLRRRGILNGTDTGSVEPKRPLKAAEAVRILYAVRYNVDVPQLYIGQYTGALPAASGPGRTVNLSLSLDNVARLSTDYGNGKPPVVEVGTWSARTDGTAVVRLTEQAGHTYEQPVTVVFFLTGSNLKAVQYDPNLYGSAGLELVKQ